MDYQLDIEILRSYIQNSLAASFVERVDNNGKPLDNVANKGGKPGDICKLERNGEFYGIMVELMGHTRPLLNGGFVERLLVMINNQDYVTPISILNLTSIDQLWYVLDLWFAKATTEYRNELSEFHQKKYPALNKWIYSVASDPIDTKMKVVGLGVNPQGDPVLPEDWAGKEFESAFTLQAAMSKLPSRLGKPPVTYAIIYTMILQKNETVLSSLVGVKYKKIIYFSFDGLFQTELSKTPLKKKDISYVVYDDTVIAFKLKNLFEPKIPSGNDKNVGILVSRLQKSIRRGRKASPVMVNTINELNVSPNYNLPEHAFMRVSAAKQLVWRLYISILEDVRPYDNDDLPSLRDLIILSLICQRAPEYMFKEEVLDSIRLLAVTAQYNDTSDDLFNWKRLDVTEPRFGVSDFQDSIYLAIKFLPMMSGDSVMLKKLCSASKKQILPFVVPEKLARVEGQRRVKDEEETKQIIEETVLASYDMHNKTSVILYYQASSPVGLTTKQISSYIWDISSSYNVRCHKEKKLDGLLLDIQASYMEPDQKRKLRMKISDVPHLSSKAVDQKSSRISFLILFGREYKYNRFSTILCGSAKQPARIKKSDDKWEWSDDSDVINGFPDTMLNLKGISPPEGYRFNKKQVKLSVRNGYPHIDDKKIKWFDGSSVLEKIDTNKYPELSSRIAAFGIQIFTGQAIDFVTLKFFQTSTHNKLCRWLPDCKGFNIDIVKLAFTKLHNDTNGIVMIGPVSRQGNKMQNAIDYLLEGKTWAVFQFFSYIWPDTLKINGSLNFMLNKTSQGYALMMECLHHIILSEKMSRKQISFPEITTPLWDHQNDSKNRIISGFLKGYHGFGDASIVGAGKTLTALAISSEIIKRSVSKNQGVLVMVPNDKLLTTWSEELEKHTDGFDIFIHNVKSKVPIIQSNTIVITTMNRNRDHPIKNRWLLVIIDECLTVQNKDALWTGAAWTQSLMSEHLIMLSATFFRARFDKLYYMLKMLQTGLPEKKEYLNTILLESIVSQVSNVQRKWISDFHYFKMDKASWTTYDKINLLKLDTEAKFAKLMSFLISDKSVRKQVAKQLGLMISKLEKQGRRCLIYARAMEEAKEWSDALSIPIYPKKGKHCIVTYNDGTYGLNDLVQYNTIVMRPASPDKIPQIKGRLDRPGQKETELFVEYFVLGDTLEMGLILRMNIASQFVQRYIMPISKFYEISVYHSEYN